MVDAMKANERQGKPAPKPAEEPAAEENGDNAAFDTSGLEVDDEEFSIEEDL